MRGLKKIPVLRYGLIVLLVSILFSGAFYLYIHYHSAQKLQVNVSKLISARENSELIDSCLLNLYSADNNSRLYALTGDKKYINLFTSQINELSAQLSRIKVGDKNISALNAGKLNGLIKEKKDKTNRYVKLRILTDSLIRSTLKIDSILNGSARLPIVSTMRSVVHIDTITATPNLTKAGSVKQKRLLGRIFSAFKSSEQRARDSAAGVPALIVKRDTFTKTTVQRGVIFNAATTKNNRNHHQLFSANSRLRDNERDILLINNNLVLSIIAELRKYKVQELAYVKESKAELAGNVTNVFQEYNYLSRLTLYALILLLIIVLYNIWKIFGNEISIIAYSEKAEQYADNKSNFMASMSHEIRTPLNSIIGFAEQLGSSKLNKDQTQQINAIRSSSQMLLEVVNEILDFSKYETGKMTFEQQPFLPHAAITEVFNSVSIQAAKKGLNFKKDLQMDEDICFTGDMFRLKQVVLNLLVNAIKFTPVGEIALHASTTYKSGDKAILKVQIKDTGIGIKKQDLPTIFDEFSQVNDAQKVTRHKGTGLGLAICKKIVELQGGKIGVTSEPGKGSIFSIELPVNITEKSECIVNKVIDNAHLAKMVAGAHVLLAEDNELNVLLAKTILRKWKITCDVAYNGQEGIALFENNMYDLVLTDIQMPIMGGLEFLSLIRASPNDLKAEVPVIALTANALKTDRDKYFNAGVNDIVLKPFNERNFVERISLALTTKFAHTDKILAQNNLMDESIADK